MKRDDDGDDDDDDDYDDYDDDDDDDDDGDDDDDDHNSYCMCPRTLGGLEYPGGKTGGHGTGVDFTQPVQH